MGTIPCFPAIFTEGNNFRDFLLLPYLTGPFQTGVYSDRTEFAPRGANSFLLEKTPLEKGRKYVNVRVISPESVPIDLNTPLYVH